jgi:hypothetical protein
MPVFTRDLAQVVKKAMEAKAWSPSEQQALSLKLSQIGMLQVSSMRIEHER